MRSRLHLLVVVLALGTGCSSLAPRARVMPPSVADAGVRFQFFAPAAHRVQLAGSWPDNNWARGDAAAGEADIGLMSDDDGDGLWQIVVALPPGRYQYVFWVDESAWRLDPGNPAEVEAGPTGRASEILVVDRDGTLEVR